MKRWVLAGALAFAAAGHTLASDLPPPGAPPAPLRAPGAYVPAITPVYNWGGIYLASIWATASAPSFGPIPTTSPASVRLAISTSPAFSLDLQWGPISRPTVLSTASRRISTAPGLTAKNRARSAAMSGSALVRSARPKISGSRPARARLGYAVDRVLFYGTDGGAVATSCLGLTAASNARPRGRPAGGCGS